MVAETVAYYIDCTDKYSQRIEQKAVEGEILYSRFTSSFPFRAQSLRKQTVAPSCFLLEIESPLSFWGRFEGEDVRRGL